MKAWDGFSFPGEGFLEDSLGSESVFQPKQGVKPLASVSRADVMCVTCRLIT